MVEDTGDLVLLVSIPILIALPLAAVFGYPTVAVLISVFGFLGVVPLVMVYDERLLDALADEEGDDAGAADPLARLRRRYAEGALSEPEFERKLEDLLASEGVAERAGAAEPEVDVDGDAVVDRER